MKKVSILFYLIICFSVSLNAQDAVSNIITLAINFSKGDTIKYSIEEGKKKYLNDKILDSVIMEKKMSLVVIDSTDKGFLMQIDMENDKKTEDLLQDFLTDESNAAILYSFKDLKMQYKISPVGVFEGFENLDALKKMAEKTFDYYLTKVKIEPQKIEKIKNTLLNKEYLESILGKYVTLLHAYHGFEYEADTIKVFDNQLPNFFSKNGGTIPAKSEFLIEYTDSTNVFAEVQQVTTADKNAMKNLMKDVSDVYGFEKKERREIEKVELELYQKITCEYHLPTGVPTYLFYRKIVDGKDKKNTTSHFEYIEIKLE